MKLISGIIIILLPSLACMYSREPKKEFVADENAYVFDTNYIAKGFDFPVGKPDANGYYNAQPFGKNTHLGDDWNGNGGGNTDLGDTVYAIANGYINFAEDIHGGWGNVIRITHKYKSGTALREIESLYAHLDNIFVTPGKYIRKGEPIGTIGTNHGMYYAHLHLEIRTSAGLPVGGGYSADTTGYTDPTKFIKANRK